MKYLKLFEIYNKQDIDTICRKYRVVNYTINSDGSIDVDDSVWLCDSGLRKLPLKFNKINGYFSCSHNNLTSLKGCPKEVGNDFYCYRNNLTSLVGGPENVGGDFNCSENKLTSLVDCPERIGGNFGCSYNNLTSLVGCPERIGGDFNCSGNKIRDFEGFPKSLGGDFYCHNNPVYEVWTLFKDKDKIELFNDYDIIRDDIIIMNRLNDFLMEIGKPTVTSVKGYKCI